MVDTIDLLLFKDVADNFVEFPCGGESRPKGFSMMMRTQVFEVAGTESRRGRLFNDLRIHLGESIDKGDCRQDFLRVEFGKSFRKFGIGLLIGVIAGL